VYGNVASDESEHVAQETERVQWTGEEIGQRRSIDADGAVIGVPRRCVCFCVGGIVLLIVVVFLFLDTRVNVTFEFGRSGLNPAAPVTTGVQNGNQPAAPATTGAHGGSQPASPVTTGAHGGNQPAAPATTGAQGGNQPAAPATTGAQGGKLPAAPATTGENNPVAPRDDSTGYYSKYNVKEVSCDDKVVKKFGSWQFYDGYTGTRPEPDYSKYPNRDTTEFPRDAWQADAVYVNHFLDEGLKLVGRAKDAIYAGYGLLDPKTEEGKLRKNQIFRIGIGTYNRQQDHAGFVTRKSFDGLVRRLLHAVMTRDTFSISVAGHSAAVGHGNSFFQNYAMQCHEVLKPVFSRLGVELKTRMIGQGGLGTMQHFLAGMDLMGPETDLLYWDSGMTEKDRGQIEFNLRQALIAGKRAPVLFMPGDACSKAKCRMKGPHPLENLTGADFYQMAGDNRKDLPLTVDEVQVQSLPYNARYLNCDPQANQMCKKNKYTGECWVDRPGFNATAGDIPALRKKASMTNGKRQKGWPPKMGGRASWHPGDRTHRLTGYTLAFAVLVALENALLQWQTQTITRGHPLAAEYWHVSKHYIAIRERALAIKRSTCESSLQLHLNPRICNIPMHGRSEFTPRADPDKTSIRTIMKSPKGGFQNSSQRPYESLVSSFDSLMKAQWTPPAMRTPEGEIHVPTILRDANCPAGGSRRLGKGTVAKTGTDMLTGQAVGWTLDHPQGFCDGSYEMTCLKSEWRKCPMYGHADARGGWDGGCLSGWLSLNIQGVKEGLIILKIEFWRGGVVLVNGTKRSKLEDPTLFFDYAVNGKVTTVNSTELRARIHQVQRVVQLFTVLDDPSQPTSQDYEVAIRLRGCGPEGAKIRLTHVYWS